MNTDYRRWVRNHGKTANRQHSRRRASEHIVFEANQPRPTHQPPWSVRGEYLRRTAANPRTYGEVVIAETSHHANKNFVGTYKSYRVPGKLNISRYIEDLVETRLRKLSACDTSIARATYVRGT